MKPLEEILEENFCDLGYTKIFYMWYTKSMIHKNCIDKLGFIKFKTSALQMILLKGKDV